MDPYKHMRLQPVASTTSLLLLTCTTLVRLLPPSPSPTRARLMGRMDHLLLERSRAGPAGAGAGPAAAMAGGVGSQSRNARRSALTALRGMDLVKVAIKQVGGAAEGGGAGGRPCWQDGGIWVSPGACSVRNSCIATLGADAPASSCVCTVYRAKGAALNATHDNAVLQVERSQRTMAEAAATAGVGLGGGEADGSRPGTAQQIGSGGGGGGGGGGGAAESEEVVAARQATEARQAKLVKSLTRRRYRSARSYGFHHWMQACLTASCAVRGTSQWRPTCGFSPL